MAVQEIHVGDTGTELQIKVVEKTKDADGVPRDVGLDISAATALLIYIRKPDGSVSSKAATSVVLSDPTDPDDGVECLMQIVSDASDFDVAGQYKYQGEITFAASGPFRTEIIPFKVHQNLA